ncbi:MAG: hypothetical protein AABX02_00135 [archaeon]
MQYNYFWEMIFRPIDTASKIMKEKNPTIILPLLVFLAAMFFMGYSMDAPESKYPLSGQALEDYKIRQGVNALYLASIPLFALLALCLFVHTQHQKHMVKNIFSAGLFLFAGVHVLRLFIDLILNYFTSIQNGNLPLLWLDPAVLFWLVMVLVLLTSFILIYGISCIFRVLFKWDAFTSVVASIFSLIIGYALFWVLTIVFIWNTSPLLI